MNEGLSLGKRQRKTFSETDDGCKMEAHKYVTGKGDTVGWHVTSRCGTESKNDYWVSEKMTFSEAVVRVGEFRNELDRSQIGGSPDTLKPREKKAILAAIQKWKAQ